MNLRHAIRITAINQPEYEALVDAQDRARDRAASPPENDHPPCALCGEGEAYCECIACKDCGERTLSGVHHDCPAAEPKLFTRVIACPFCRADYALCMRRLGPASCGGRETIEFEVAS